MSVGASLSFQFQVRLKNLQNSNSEISAANLRFRSIGVFFTEHPFQIIFSLKKEKYLSESMENLQNTYHWISFHDLNRIRKRLDFIGTNCFSCAIIFHIFASSFVQTYPRQLKSQGSDPKRFLLHFPHWKIYNNATLDKSGTQPRRIRH